jgi:prepilin-type N-terminal cleavage/methylation domain-containing protein
MKIQTFARGERRAFTLIELLIVITIVGVLTALSFPAYKALIDRAHRLDARITLSGLQTGISNYVSDYNRVPARGPTDTEITLSPGTSLIKAMLGDNVDGLNPRGTAYLDAKMATNGINGLAGADENWALIDPWGQPYRVALDTDGDGWVQNPDSENEDPAIAKDAPRRLPMHSIAHSAGPDKKWNTQDDIASWRR